MLFHPNSRFMYQNYKSFQIHWCNQYYNKIKPEKNTSFKYLYYNSRLTTGQQIWNQTVCKCNHYPAVLAVAFDLKSLDDNPVHKSLPGTWTAHGSLPLRRRPAQPGNRNRDFQLTSTSTRPDEVSGLLLTWTLYMEHNVSGSGGRALFCLLTM